MGQNYCTEEECLLAIERHLMNDSAELCRIAALIAEGLCRKYHADLNDVEDLVQGAVLYTLKHAHKFSPGRKTAFFYLSMVAKTGLVNGWRKIRSDRRLLQDYAEHLAGQPMTRRAEVLIQ